MTESPTATPVWHTCSVEGALAALQASPEGLGTGEARRRLAAHGPNALAAGPRRTPVRILARQLTDFMVLVLLGAAGVSALLGDVTDTIGIVAIVILNAVVGFVQEYRAERAMEALRAMAAPTATVLRDGAPRIVPAEELVPGDVVLLEAGRIVPADLRLIATASMRTDEASLTGESVPVDKTVDALPSSDLALGDRTNMAFKSTVATYGRGCGVVVATGMATELGRIAAHLAEAGETATPLQRRLADVGRRIAVAVLAICGVVFVAGLLRGEAPLLMFMTAVSLAVAAIPEALPAVVTVSLALGARAMVRRKALVRRLPAVESLGSVTVICSDKTGTLTVNRMSAETFHCGGETADALGAGAPWDDLRRAMALDNDAAPDAEGRIVGDPLEVALLCAARAGDDADAILRDHPRVAEIPFDAERRCMTTVHRDPRGGFVAFTKGATEALLARATTVATGGDPQPRATDAITAATDRMAADGLRVLACAMRRWDALPAAITSETMERELTLLGLVGVVDPPREEARAAVATCRAAGIVPVMITGDHPGTARAIARRLGILDEGDAVLTGPELAALGPDALAAAVRDTRVYARVAPEQKLAIVRALQEGGEIVAMTGDGVNDGPALKQADVGVAMGITGTDVAKEASDLVLLDDHFATIVGAVREGRRIFDNLRRFIRYALTTNAAEVWIVLAAPVLGLPMPLLPIQLLWINLVTDGFPGLALAGEPAEPDVMQRPPRPPSESLLARGLGRHVVWVSVLMAGLGIATEAVAIRLGVDGWRTMVFTGLAVAQLGHVLAIRSERESLFAQGLRSNPALLVTVAATLAVQLAAIYVPAMNAFLETEPLSALELALTLAAGSVVFVAVEIEKWFARRAAPPPSPPERPRDP
jgi:Ca2+-transporting ATPase